MSIIHQDPAFQEIGASLRKKVLFVKAPLEKVIRFCEALNGLDGDLLLKEVHYNPESMHQSVVFEGSVADWEEDLVTLIGLDPGGTSEIIMEFRRAVAGGLLANSEFDWMARVQGSCDHAATHAVASVTATPTADTQEVLELP